jgi:hypothetical protein
MQAVLTHIRAAVLILIHLGMVIGLEAGHTERFLVSGSGRETVASHDCGARERHITLDHLHNCQACVFQLQHTGSRSPFLHRFLHSIIRVFAVLPAPEVTQADVPPSFFHFQTGS